MGMRFSLSGTPIVESVHYDQDIAVLDVQNAMSELEAHMTEINVHIFAKECLRNDLISTANIASLLHQDPSVFSMEGFAASTGKVIASIGKAIGRALAAIGRFIKRIVTGWKTGSSSRQITSLADELVKEKDAVHKLAASGRIVSKENIDIMLKSFDETIGKIMHADKIEDLGDITIVKVEVLDSPESKTLGDIYKNDLFGVAHVIGNNKKAHVTADRALQEMRRDLDAVGKTITGKQSVKPEDVEKSNLLTKKTQLLMLHLGNYVTVETAVKGSLKYAEKALKAHAELED